MKFYILKRLLLIIPTIFVILLINFAIIQTAPGGPVERFLSQINHNKINGETANLQQNGLQNGIDVKNFNNSNSNRYQGANGVDEELIKKIETLYGFDQPLPARFWKMICAYAKFDFGESFYQDKKIVDLIIQKLPTSISLGLWSTILIYSISIILGVKKAVQDGTRFDLISSSIIIVLHAIPAFLLAIILVMLFCGGHFLNIFPLRGLTSPDFDQLNFFQKIFDYLHHITLPVLSMVLGGFASLTFFCKNSFIEEIGKNYVLCAKAKGLSENQVLWRHVFRNAMLIVIANLPAVLIGVFFTSSMLIEVIFSLDGLGLLSYEAAISRDYPLMFATLYIFTVLGLLNNLISDLTYRLIDPRIDFESR